MSPFEVVQAIQSAGVGVVWLDLRRTVVVLRSVDDQDVGETAVIRFQCVSRRIEKFGGSHEGKVKLDYILSGVSHRPITEGTGESSSRNYVFFLFFLFL
jgi:hypothetical protein